MRAMRPLFLVFGSFLSLCQTAYWFFWRNYQKAKFAHCGHNVYLGRYCHFTYNTISIGEDVYIGSNACMQSVHGNIIIGNHVMFGPNVHIHGGNHEFRIVGKLMKELTDKDPGSDGTVRIGNDVWIGANVTILCRVTIGDGSVIGAGCVITKDVAPYSIIVGNLPRKILQRFDEETLKTHIAMLTGNATARDGVPRGVRHG